MGYEYNFQKSGLRSQAAKTLLKTGYKTRVTLQLPPKHVTRRKNNSLIMSAKALNYPT